MSMHLSHDRNRWRPSPLVGHKDVNSIVLSQSTNDQSNPSLACVIFHPVLSKSLDFCSINVWLVLHTLSTVKPVLSGHSDSKVRPKIVFKTDYRLMLI